MVLVSPLLDSSVMKPSGKVVLIALEVVGATEAVVVLIAITGVDTELVGVGVGVEGVVVTVVYSEGL